MALWTCLITVLLYPQLLLASTSPLMGHYKPLQGSEWARDPENLGKLPFEKCRIDTYTNRSPLKRLEYQAVIGSSGPSIKTDENLYLTCAAPSLNLAYRIPITVNTGRVKFGLHAESPISINFASRIRLANVHKRPLFTAFGEFYGKSIGGGIFALGGKNAVLKSDSGIEYHITSLTAGTLFGAGTAYLLVMPRESISMEECHDPFILMSGNLAKPREIEKDCARNEPFGLETAMTPVDRQTLNVLDFEKIKGH